MSQSANSGLLPAGLQDLLAPDAAHEAAVVERLMASFAAHGYERVKPPLMEFEETLLAGAGAAVSQQTFRLMDPVSQRMMALRADITPQVARIAATRLRQAPRPLRLCYAGQVLRVKGSQLRPQRQFGQAGAELIGAPRPEADAEVALLAAAALSAAGVAGISIDLNQPTLVTAVARGLKIESEATARLRQALDRKDAAAVAGLAGRHAALFQALLSEAGPAPDVLPALKALALPDEARAELERLDRVAALIGAAAPDLTLTVDPVEHRGFEYQTGVSFTLFARRAHGELGRGGRYATEYPDGASETATGFTLYMDTVLRAVPAPERAQRLYLPPGTDRSSAGRLRAEGWATVAGLDPGRDSLDEARRLGCSHVWLADQIQRIED